MYIVVRTWTNASAVSDKIMERRQEVTDLLKAVPGFRAYYATRDGDTLTTVTVCESKAGTDESTRRAGEWVKANLAGAAVGAPSIAEGETFIQF
jgi:hypothetical protein